MSILNESDNPKNPKPKEPNPPKRQPPPNEWNPNRKTSPEIDPGEHAPERVDVPILKDKPASGQHV